MSFVSVSKYAKYTSYVDEVMDEIEKSEFKLRRKAARMLKSKMRRKVSGTDSPSMPGQSPKRVSGNLRKGIKDVNQKKASYVGTVGPAYHGHLLEFGHDMKIVNPGVNKWGPNAGKAKLEHVKPRPFVYPTFNENVKEVAAIMAEEKWVK